MSSLVVRGRILYQSLNMSRNFNKGQKTHKLSKNAIDSEVKAFLRPLNLMQSSFFMSMYSFRDNFITKKSAMSITFSLLSVIVATAIYIVRIVKKGIPDMLYFINNLFDTVFYSFGFALLFYVCIDIKDYNINLVLKIQDIYRSRTITRHSLRRITKISWNYFISSTIIYGVLSCTSFYFNRENRFISMLEILCFCMLVVFDVNIVYYTQIIKILTVAMRQWVIDLKYYTIIKNIIKNLRENEPENCYWRKKETAFANILEAFDILKGASQLLVSTYCIL